MKLHCWYSTVILTSAALHFALSPASADAAADAVRAARSTTLPDFEGVISEGRNSGALDGFGGGNLDEVRDAEALYRDGEGLLYAPAANRVVGCRSASDPECRAVQVLDRGFPERPSVPEDVLIGRDDVVDNAAGSRPGGIGSSESCRDFTITIPERVETEVCSAGSPFADFTCRTGWETSTEILTRWACRMGSAYREALACRIVSRPGTVTETPVACWFGPDYPKSTYSAPWLKSRNLRHPTIKNVEFLSWLIQISSLPGELVFDPFMGSGSTALAAHKTGRHYLCCEIDSEYCELYRRRMSQE